MRCGRLVTWVEVGDVRGAAHTGDGVHGAVHHVLQLGGTQRVVVLRPVLRRFVERHIALTRKKRKKNLGRLLETPGCLYRTERSK